ncbi:hypothetical protein PPACK8108_LOCUS19782 [Phakopsora pachyrhizi]|uniref:Piwi domain-containing protein n=1 Tax=Phakopsora pachyrhizi TaxID=170000 RepID=A0AAV0BEQ7_PHAPC|nr:hypothetical protein PPACK8108_LOCUS19782 [Phakopsora pachyrhizi]
MSAHSAAATNSRVYLPTNCSAALEVLKCSESAVGFQASASRFTGSALSIIPMMLIGQASLNGTSCCTRYLVLKDETNHAVDDPQKIANSVCSASQRATKSVGIATPTYYANLVATRAKKWDISDENGSTVFTTNSGAQTSDDKLLKRHFRIQYSIPENDKNDDKLNNKDGDGGD